MPALAGGQGPSLEPRSSLPPPGQFRDVDVAACCIALAFAPRARASARHGGDEALDGKACLGMQPDEGCEWTAGPVDDVGSVPAITALLDFHDPTELLQEISRSLDARAKRRIPTGGMSGQAAPHRADYGVQIVPAHRAAHHVKELVQEWNVPFGEEQLRPGRQPICDGRAARSGALSRAHHQPLALELLQVRADRVMGDAQGGGQFLHRAVSCPQQVDDLTLGACEKSFPPAAQRHR